MSILLRYANIFVYYILVVIGLLCYKEQYRYILPFLCSILGAFLFLLPVFSKKRILVLLILTVYSFALGCEIASIYNTGNLLEVLSLANVTEISSVGNAVIFSSLGIFFSLFAGTWLIGGRRRLVVSKYIYLLFIPLGVFYFFYDNIKPMTSFTTTFVSYVKQLSFHPEEKIAKEQMKLYGKDWIYHSKTSDNVPDLHGKNIVALFTEGLSLNVIDRFNDYPELTPYMSAFWDKAIWFDNYYNHTAATYRGIRGQLSSSYQYAAGLGKDWDGHFDVNEIEMANLSYAPIVFLQEILRQNGYSSYFICAHRAGDKMIKYLRTLGFDKVYSAGDFKSDNTDLTDGEIFYYLHKLMTSGELKEPYFIGFYNLGTHMGFSTRYTVYQNSTGKNNIELNNLYEYDRGFGYFMKKIWEDSVLLKKTAVVLTADHAMPPVSDKLDAFHQVRTHFMDKIPLVLWYDGVVSKRMDAEGKNSLDFAPTLLNWLRINEAHNYFLGCSLYDESCALPFQYVHNEGNTFISSKSFKMLYQDEPEDAKIIGKIRDFYNLSEYRVFRWNLE